MSAPRLTSRERRGILAVAAVALLVTGAGMLLRLTRPATPLPPTAVAIPDSAHVLIPADTSMTGKGSQPKDKRRSKGNKRKSEAKIKRKRSGSSGKGRKSDPSPAASPLDRPVKTL